MLTDCRSCVCISGCVKHGVKSYCVKVGAADPGPVVTVAWPFVGRPSTVNLLYSPHTKDCLHLWLLGGGVPLNQQWRERDLADLSEFFLRQAVQMTQGILGIPLSSLQSAKPFLLKCEGIPSRMFNLYVTKIMLNSSQGISLSWDFIIL